ncbi:MAG: hypothetical protein IPP14_02505 [Planctomycetes bacterium]|nr:hypothetical protein [Planctomycetota bacterium]
MYDPEALDDRAVEKITRRYAGLKPAETAIRLREKYTRRREAISRFTETLVREGFVDDTEVVTLRAVGVSEEEIEALVEKYGVK